MKRMLTVTIDRAENSNHQEAKVEIEKVLAAYHTLTQYTERRQGTLKPLNVRVAMKTRAYFSRPDRSRTSLT
jgi:hypothetical protein